MTSKLPINLANLLRQRTVEGERIEYKAGWNPESVLHALCAFANDFYNLGGGYIVIVVSGRRGGRSFRGKNLLGAARPHDSRGARLHPAQLP